MTQPIPHQPCEAKHLHRIFGEIIRDFKTYHTTGSEHFKGNFNLEDKMLQLSDVFDMFFDIAYQTQINAQAERYVTTYLNVMLRNSIDDDNPTDHEDFKNRMAKWIDRDPDGKELDMFNEQVCRILYRNCFMRNKPVEGESLGDCGFVREVLGWLER